MLSIGPRPQTHIRETTDYVQTAPARPRKGTSDRFENALSIKRPLASAPFVREDDRPKAHGPALPLTDANHLIHRLARDGVRVKLITGDNELMTRHLCESVGLDASRIVLGDEMEKMSDSALGQVADEVSAIARVSPA